ncbi:hypothetical protein DSO57_1006577 [Entomophthora muscae]|uniref:Uncharacterized protein n=1 Tax=Entomophthora muscae TaxID=34485 RepID=A0ACC2TVE6_9FUNG|nr:hypothetical protein DSO57_1006577 [Entomophthora muscae]
MYLWLALIFIVGSISVKELDILFAKCNGIDIREITIAQAHRHYRIGRLTPWQLTACYLERIRKLDGSLFSVLEINSHAEEEAAKVRKGPLYGIPVLVNVNMHVRGMDNIDGLFFRGFKPKHEALAIQRLRAQGAVILGKTNLSKISGLIVPLRNQGIWQYPDYPKNPYNLTRTMYGLSSGSAVAVAANLAMAALGTETDGTLINPSLMTSLYGFKPSLTRGMLDGMIPIAPSMDTVSQTIIFLAFSLESLLALLKIAP